MIPPADLGRPWRNGFESLWVAEHTHIPASRRSSVARGCGAPADVLRDPRPSSWRLPAAADGHHDPEGRHRHLPRAPARSGSCWRSSSRSLDVVSNGRFLFGVGGGWNAEEMENHGGEFSGRWKLMRERIEAMKAIWAADPAEYHGELVDFDPIWSKPKPVQTPHPPIHVGGTAPYGPRRAARYGNGWIPINGRGDIIDELPILAAECEKVGRDPAEIELTLYAAPTDRAEIERLEAAGVHRLVFGLPQAGADVVLPLLDSYAAVIHG
ncbi:MAG: LLM class flavin-dependent oxidoreductase [Acidimicrobiales bacterium]